MTKKRRRKEKRREVAVKVRHPGVVDALKRDFKILLWFASFTRNISWLEPLQLENTVGQFGVHMLSQVDLGVEAEKFKPISKILPVNAGGILSYAHNIVICGRCTR